MIGLISYFRYLSQSQVKLLKFDLSLRNFSPKIEMFQQIAIDRGVHELDCDAVIEFDGKLTCDFPSDLANNNKDTMDPVLIDQDHQYVHWDDRAKNTVILYARVGSQRFANLHKRLSALASQGKVKYVFRHFLKKRHSSKLRMSGYGVELQIKSSEYKAQDDRKVTSDDESSDDADSESSAGNDKTMNGFDFDKLSEKNPEDKEKLAEFKQFLVDENNPMAPMKVWQLQDLSLQAAVRVLNSDNQIDALVDLSQNFPSYARQLSKTSIPKDIKKEVKKNRDTFYERMNMAPTDAGLFINGMHYDMDYVDIFTILDAIKSESKVLDGLGRLGLTDEQAAKMISLDLTGSKQQYGVDVRDTAVNWINNLEKDKMYKGWPASVTEMLRPTFPGMMRSVRKNFFNVVILADPSKAQTRPLLRMLESFYIHRAPTRIGIVFAVNSDQSVTGLTDAGVAMMNAYNYVATTKSPADGLSFITDVYLKIDTDGIDIDVDTVHNVFKEKFGTEIELKDVFDEDSEYDVGRQLAKDFLSRSGFKPAELPQVLMNGVPLDKKNLNGEDFEETLMMSIMRETQTVQKAVYRNELNDNDDCLDYMMKQPNIMPRLNDRVLKTEDSTVLDLTGEALPNLKLDTFAALTKEMMAGTIAKHMNYITNKDDNKLHMMTSWVVADLETPEGRDIVRGAIAQVKSSSQFRLGIVQNSDKPDMISKIVEATLESQTPAGAKNILAKVLKEATVKDLESGKKKLSDFDIPGADMDKLIETMSSKSDAIAEKFDIYRTFAEKALDFNGGENGVLLNGKVIGPLDDEEVFGQDDFNLLEKFSMSQYGDKMVNAFYTNMDVKAKGVSDLAMKLASLLVSRPESKSRTPVHYYDDKKSVIKIEPTDPSVPSFDITAVMDPLSQGAQKISSILSVLSKVVNARIRVFMNCVDKHSDMPQKSYFR